MGWMKVQKDSGSRFFLNAKIRPEIVDDNCGIHKQRLHMQDRSQCPWAEYNQQSHHQHSHRRHRA
jgi:hypothetical protein